MLNKQVILLYLYDISIPTMMKKLLILSIFTFSFSFFIAAQKISTVAGDRSYGAGYSGDGGPATNAELNDPLGVAIDASGNLYISDYNDFTIRKVNTSGIISTLAGNHSYGHGYSGDGGPATAAELFEPWGITFDASGNLYIADWGNNIIRKVNTSGIISTFAGNHIFGYSGDGGPATAAELRAPNGVAVDASGNLYIGEESNYDVRKVNTSEIINTIAGNQVLGYSGDGGPAAAAELREPYGIALDPADNLYISDFNNNLIRKVNTSGIISTVAGNYSYGHGYSGDGGAATAAELNGPAGIACDASGTLYIADVRNGVVRKVNTSGIISTLAGNHISGYSGDGGPATAAELNDPVAICFDASRSLYISDNSNYVIRKVSQGCNFGTPSAVVIQDLLCNGISNGDAQVIVNGGTYPLTYLWSNGSTGVSSGAFLGPQTYTVTVHDANGCTTTASVSLTQPPAISLKMDSINGLNCNGFAKVSASGGAPPYSYLWQPGCEKGDSILKQCTGIYCCKVTDHNGCVKNICVNLVTGVDELSVDNGQLTIFPNPSNGLFTLSFSHPELVSGSHTIEIYNVTGQKVYSTLLPQTSKGTLHSIDLGNQPSGVYLYKVTDENSAIIGEGKLVIEK